MLGQLRALLTVVGTALATFGYHRGYSWEPVIGVVALMASLGWSVYYKEGWEAIQSVIRKIASAIGTGVVVYGMMTPEKSEALVGIVGPLMAMFGSWKANGGKFPPVGTGVKLLLAVMLVAGALVGGLGCAEYTLQGELLTDAGAVIVDSDGLVTFLVDQRSGK